MDYLDAVIQLFDHRELGAFRKFLIRTGREQARRDIKLVGFLARHDDAGGADLSRKIYGTTNLNAYHSLRKRLQHQASSFLVLNGLEEEDVPFVAPLRIRSVARFLVSRGAVEEASRFLAKAERISIAADALEALHAIYAFRMQYAQELQEETGELLKKWQPVRAVLARREKLGIARGLISQKLAATRRAGTTMDLEELTHSVFREIDLEKSDLLDATFMFAVASIVRSGVISTRDYFRFEPFVIDTYNRLRRAHAFRTTPVILEARFVYMIAHVLYRNRKFSRSDKMIAKLEDVIPGARSHEAAGLRTRILLLKAANRSFSGQNDLAADLLKRALKKRQIQIDTPDRLNMLINLAVYQFQADNFREAMRTIHSIHHTDPWLEKKMGREWRFKKNLIELIIHYELGHEDIALSRIRTLEKHFESFLKHPFYQRAGTFLGILRTLMKHPGVARTAAFATAVDAAGLELPGEREDIQAITFYCWLTSKMTGKKYYDQLLETIRKMG